MTNDGHFGVGLSSTLDVLRRIGDAEPGRTCLQGGRPSLERSGTRGWLCGVDLNSKEAVASEETRTDIYRPST